jgi:hypothetical protein
MRARLAGAAALATVAAVWAATPALAQEPVATIDWTTTAPASGVVVDGAARIMTTSGGTFPLAAIDVADLGTTGYEMRGQVRYDDVAGSSYLEMWSVFPDGGRYFTRTLATDGPMASLSGTSDWRAFELPFFLNGSSPPKRLEINVVLAAAGTVDVGRLELVPLPAGAGTDGAWLSQRELGLVGAMAGSTIGLFGALIGVLVGRRRGRGFVLPAMTIAAVVGVALIVLAGIALLAGQPMSMAYVLFLPGAILALACGLGVPRVRRLYAEAELRRMRALDHG